ncbi:MAG: hypothetical protein ACR2RV_24500, partial [Verrucomicrobiales bacterium]
ALQAGDRPTRTGMEETLDGIIPQLDFNEATLEDAVDFLRQKSRELDPAKDPRQRGVNVVIRSKGGGKRQPGDGLITLSMKNVSLKDAFTRLADLADMTVDFNNPLAIIFHEKAEQ